LTWKELFSAKGTRTILEREEPQFTTIAVKIMPAVQNIHEVGIPIFFRADDTLIILFFPLYHGVGALDKIIDYDFVDFGVFGVAAVFAVVVEMFYGLVGGD